MTDPIETFEIVRRLQRSERQRDALAVSLRAVFRLLDDGDLVRNIEHDADAVRFLKQGTRITGAIAEGNAALAELEKP